ncbi:MAG TPA: phytanoyl-CoA dioxygenase family protein [Blastocatellia bacterium]|nr:phytanoyl-CoA dioxygenase family protein [Blastocatellia bacterium]
MTGQDLKTEDLSAFHGLIGSLFSLPSSPGDWIRFGLSAAQVDFFNEQGYLAGIPILTEEQVERLKTELNQLMDPSNPGTRLFYEYHTNESRDASKVIFHALGAWRITEGFHDLLWNPAFTMPATQLLGGRVRFWHDQLFCKPARHGGVVAWHQDYSYWTRTRPLAHLTCWIALDDADRENGCLHYIPGSHLWPDLPVTGLTGDMNAIESVLNSEQKQLFRPVAIELGKGFGSFHHPRMIHGSYANSTDRPRRATVINVFRDGVCSASDEPLLEGVPVIPRGEKMGGRFFPLLLDPSDLPCGS